MWEGRGGGGEGIRCTQSTWVRWVLCRGREGKEVHEDGEEWGVLIMESRMSGHSKKESHLRSIT